MSRKNPVKLSDELRRIADQMDKDEALSIVKVKYHTYKQGLFDDGAPVEVYLGSSVLIHHGAPELCPAVVNREQFELLAPDNVERYL